VAGIVSVRRSGISAMSWREEMSGGENGASKWRGNDIGACGGACNEKSMKAASGEMKRREDGGSIVE